MRHAWLRTVGVACALAVALGAADIPIAQEREKVHTKSGKKIADKLNPGDKDVEVIDARENPGLVEPSPGESWLDGFVQGADMIVVATLLRQRAFLADAGDEVRSSLTFRVVEVLKAMPDSTPLDIGDQFDWDEAIGGTVQIGATRVHVRRPWGDGFKNGARYLVFIGVAPPDDVLGGGRLVLNETSFFAISGQRLVSMGGLQLHSITDVPYPVVKANIRSAKPRK